MIATKEGKRASEGPQRQTLGPHLLLHYSQNNDFLLSTAAANLVYRWFTAIIMMHIRSENNFSGLPRIFPAECLLFFFQM